MLVQITKDTFEPSLGARKKTPDIYRRGDTKDLPDDVAHALIDAKKAVRFDTTVEQEDKPKKKGKKEETEA